MEWPEDVYDTVKTAKGTILNATEDTDLVMPVAAHSNFDKGLPRKIKERFREVEIINNTQKTIGEITYLERRMGIPEGGEVRYRSSYLFVVTQKGKEGESATHEELFVSIIKLKNLMQALGIKN